MMLVDDDGELVNMVENVIDFRDENQIALQRSLDAEYANSGSVSTLHRCQTVDAKKLCVYDLNIKFKYNSEFDIGGTYTSAEADLWFYYSTSLCPGNNYLFNLFVCHRKSGNFSIGVSNSNELKLRDRATEDSGWVILPRSLAWFTFKSSEPNESYYIKTFCFTDKDVKSFDENILFIPISIIMNSSHSLNNDFVKSIKLQHDLSNLLSKKEKTDFILESVNRKKFSAHKIILAAHSPLLRNLIKDSETSSLFIDISDSDMELLLEFLYTGTIKGIFKRDCVSLLRIADKFQLSNLFLLAQYAIAEQINVENAVEVALLAQRYKLEDLRFKVLSFIKNNPRVMVTDGWKSLDDVELTKQLVEHIYTGKTE